MTRSITVRKVALPDLGVPLEPRPELDSAIYTARLARVRERMREQAFDALVVYGDREHFANLHYLTNYDPRFEEAVLIVLPEGVPSLLVGNEGMGYSKIARLAVDRVLYQTFSLPGQPRERVRPLADLLGDRGLRNCRRVGVIGWKMFSAAEFDSPENVLDLPEFIAVALRQAVGADGRVLNATAMLIDPETGLRNVSEAAQLADFEWVATCNSQAVLDGLLALQPGMKESELFTHLSLRGYPMCCHPVCAAGPRVREFGFPSPSEERIQAGDPLFLSCSYQGANCCRFGWVSSGPSTETPWIDDYIARVSIPYFESLLAWYSTLRVGATGDDLHHAVTDILGRHGLTVGLNCGHQIGYDEWTHSLVSAGSQQKIRSGMYWQADFFPSAGEKYIGAFAEDGVAVADEKLRDELSARYPAMWKRIQARRQFMIETLGIPIADDVLPFSNIPGAVIPCLLTPDACCAWNGPTTHEICHDV
jgi:Xaa-Pro aminopeptidase